MFSDQRTMTGPVPLETVEEVTAAWAAYAANPLHPGYGDGRVPGTLLTSDLTVGAYVSDGRWVADCVTPGCNGGLACWPQNALACCLDCGYVYRVDFPSKKNQVQAEEILSVRPQVNRNWRPDKGERIKMLVAENLTAGLKVPKEIS